MSKLSKIEKEILHEFMETQNLFFAADKICQKRNIGLVYQRDKFEIHFTDKSIDNKKQSWTKKQPEWIKKYDLGLDIIWSTVTLYRFLSDEKMIFDFNEKSEYQESYLGHPQDQNTILLVKKNEIPDIVKASFFELMSKEIHITTSLQKYVKKNCRTDEEIKHRQILAAAWVAIIVSLLTSSAGVFIQFL